MYVCIYIYTYTYTHIHIQQVKAREQALKDAGGEHYVCLLSS